MRKALYGLGSGEWCVTRSGRLEGDFWIGGQFKLEIEVDRSANVSG
jgi:hypothetical protein